MGTHLIPREISGDARILYVFTTKGFLFAMVGFLIGLIFKGILGLFKATFVGWIVLVAFTLIGWAIGQANLPDSNANSFFKKVGGEPIDALIMRYFKFNKNKKIYVNKVAVEKDVEK